MYLVCCVGFCQGEAFGCDKLVLSFGLSKLICCSICAVFPGKVSFFLLSHWFGFLGRLGKVFRCGIWVQWVKVGFFVEAYLICFVGC